MAFIRRIRDICGDRTTQIVRALQTLYGVLERQNASEEQLRLVQQMMGTQEANILRDHKTALGSYADLREIHREAERVRAIDFPHRGCW